MYDTGPHIARIAALVKQTGARTVLDFWCGTFAESDGLVANTAFAHELGRAIPDVDVTSYDPDICGGLSLVPHDGVVVLDAFREIDDPAWAEHAWAEVADHARLFIYAALHPNGGRPRDWWIKAAPHFAGIIEVAFV